MADPICRWRNPYVDTVKELIALLPKEELPQDQARDIVKRTNPDFYRTPYQLACQLGLYYETNGRYFPKFSSTPSDEDLLRYLTNWIIHYSVPNPYTNGFDQLQPFSVHSAICARLLEAKSSLPWEEVSNNIFAQRIGNDDILRNSINTYSPAVQIKAGTVSLRDGVGYDDLAPYVRVDITNDRDDKEYFFDLFASGDEPARTLEEAPTAGLVSAPDRAALRQIHNDPGLSPTEKMQLAAARIGQGLFRRNLITGWGICAITGVADARLLIASHIKPWRVSSNQERLDSNNGLLLTPTYDKLFDRKLISFDDDKRMLLSPSLTEIVCKKLNLVHNRVCPELPLEGRREYMAYHREKFNLVRG